MGVHTTPPPPPPLAGSLLPVVMVIRGFGQDYEIFYLATSAPMQRTSKPAPQPPPSLLRLPTASRASARQGRGFYRAKAVRSETGRTDTLVKK